MFTAHGVALVVVAFVVVVAAAFVVVVFVFIVVMTLFLSSPIPRVIATIVNPRTLQSSLFA